MSNTFAANRSNKSSQTSGVNRPGKGTCGGLVWLHQSLHLPTPSAPTLALAPARPSRLRGTLALEGNTAEQMQKLTARCLGPSSLPPAGNLHVGGGALGCNKKARLTGSLRPPYKEGVTILCPWWRKRRHRELRRLARGHTARKPSLAQGPAPHQPLWEAVPDGPISHLSRTMPHLKNPTVWPSFYVYSHAPLPRLSLETPH